MSSIYRNHTNGLLQEPVNKLRSNIDMTMLSYAGAILVPIVSFVSLYLYLADEGSLLPKFRDCTTSNDFELYIYICSSFGR